MAGSEQDGGVRVLLAHNFYQQAGGEDAVVENERALLASHGHEVRLCCVSNDGIDGAWRTLQVAWRAPYSHEGRERVERAIADFAPHLVHVHNFFPLLTPSVYDACRQARVPVVQTLHNYRAICAAALLMRNGRPCQDCVGGSSYPAVLHRCYRNSRLGSLAVARMVDVHRRRGTWRTKVDRFIALTEFAKGKFVEAGFPAQRISVKPNFVAERRGNAAGGGARRGALFVGRLSPEKGIDTLLEAWRSLDVPLRVIGDGPLLEGLRNAALPNVSSLGRMAPDAVAAEMERAQFLVLPSLCYENFPLTIAEAFCRGLPVIASRLGALEEIVEEGVTGLHFAPGEAGGLAAKVRWAAEHPEEMRRMGLSARRVYERRYSAEVNYRLLSAIYREAFAQGPDPGPA